MMGLRLWAAVLACCVRGLAGGAGERLNQGPRHAAVYAEFREARRRCDAEGLWKARKERWGSSAFSRRTSLVYKFHNDTGSWQDCAYGEAARVPAAPWAQDDGDAAVRFWRMFASLNGRASRCAQRRYMPRVLDASADPLGPTLGRWAAPRLEECRVDVANAAEGATAWAFQRAAPLVGRGGYDWHLVLWDGVGPQAADEGPWNVDAWFVGATDVAGGAILGYPPVHVHHAHARRRPEARGGARTRGTASAGSEGRGALVFESHADTNCVGGGGGGTACFVRVLPDGVAVRVGDSLTFDAQFNDVRLPRDGPRPFAAEVALRWHPVAEAPRRAAALVTVGNVGAPRAAVSVIQRFVLSAGNAPALRIYSPREVR